MVGIVKVDTLQNNAGTSSVGMDYVVNGSAKAWVSFDTDAVINESFNGSSIVDNSTGQFKYNINSALNSSNFAELTSVGVSKHFSGWFGIRSTTVCGILTFNNSHGYQDYNDMNISINGDLA
tara:strand:+ start:879 stop:1244 length:366 start_codon:yes stop_codon:yes gene_type:complete